MFRIICSEVTRHSLYDTHYKLSIEYMIKTNKLFCFCSIRRTTHIIQFHKSIQCVISTLLYFLHVTWLVAWYLFIYLFISFMDVFVLINKIGNVNTQQLTAFVGHIVVISRFFRCMYMYVCVHLPTWYMCMCTLHMHKMKLKWVVNYLNMTRPAFTTPKSSGQIAK